MKKALGFVILVTVVIGISVWFWCKHDECTDSDNSDEAYYGDYYSLERTDPEEWEGTENQVLVPSGDGYSIADTLGNLLVSSTFDAIYPCGYQNNGVKYSLIKTDSIYSFLDITNDRVLKPAELAAGWESHIFRNGGLLPITLDYLKWGYLDSIGRMSISPQWEHVTGFEKGIARVINNIQGRAIITLLEPTPGTTGYINTAGEYVIPMEYSYIDYFRDANVARFTKGVFRFDKEKAWNPYEGYKYGLIAIDGTIVLADDTYDYIQWSYFHKTREEFFIVIKGDEMGMINTKGGIIFELDQYDKSEKLYDSIDKMINKYIEQQFGILE